MIIDKKIGFIGLGNVGKKLANSILEGNFDLFVHDINKNKALELISKGAKWKNSIKEIAESSSIILTCLPSPKVVKEVISGYNGLVHYVNQTHLWIEMSTTDENEMITLAKLIEKKKGNVLEAPVTGGQHRAATGNIAVLAAGKRKIFDRAFPVLSEMGYEILYCGKLGNASTLKVVTNYLASINLLSLGEALMVCKKYGLDLKTAFHGIKISSGNSFVHETESQVILNGSYDVGFTMDLVNKDVRLFDKLINLLNIPAEISPLMVKIFEEGMNKYGKRAFSTSIVKRLEDSCDTKLRAKGFPPSLTDNAARKKGYETKI